MTDAPPERRWARRRPGGTRKLLAWLAVVALAALAGVLLAERNARTYSLALVDGALVVKKGLLFPVGTRAWVPGDPKLAPAYAPLQPPPGAAVPQEQRFSGREELDQALFDHLARWSRDDLAAAARERVARATGYLARAALLPGLSASQRQDLERLRAETGFHEGRDLVGQALDALREARDRLERTARSTSPHAGDAAEALRQLEVGLDALHRAGRALRDGAPSPPAPGPDAAAAPAAPGPADAQSPPAAAQGASAPAKK
jgi:hypothetical protein